MGLGRRRFLGLAAAAMATGACERLARGSPARATDELDTVARRIVYGGQSMDGIPPIDFPDYDTPASLGGLPTLSGTLLPPRLELRDDDLIDGLVPADGRPRAYPRLVTVWHEVVNETFAGEPVAVTFCPLTGSTVVFSGRLADGKETSLGTSGQVLDSNLVLYDRDSQSYWPQLLGVAVSGSRKGQRLRELPLAVTTTYGRWKRRYPNTLVLNNLTGRQRPYGVWPYGDYDTSDRLVFPVGTRDGRFHPKKVFVGIREGNAALAIAKERALAEHAVNLEVGGAPLVALADPELAAVRVFRRTARGRALRFAARGEWAVDEQTASRWSFMGVAVSGPLATERLEQVSAFEVQWFAWYAFYPGTAVLA